MMISITIHEEHEGGIGEEKCWYEESRNLGEVLAKPGMITSVTIHEKQGDDEIVLILYEEVRNLGQELAKLPQLSELIVHLFLLLNTSSLHPE